MPEIIKQLKPLVLSELNPPLQVTLVENEAGLAKLQAYFIAKETAGDFAVGLDTETNVVDDFWFRRVRLFQLGDREHQFIIDLLAFAGSKDALIASQGEYGKNMGGIYDKIFEVIDPILCSNKFLKVGQNLGFEYQVFHWCFGKRIWHLFSTDMAERVIQAGTISLKKMAEFSMASIAGRHFGLLIDKSVQETFDLESPLTQEQIDYAAFDVRFPHALRQAQVNIMTQDQLLATAQIENDAIGTFTDMHLVGQNLDDAKWIERIKHVIERRIEELKVLDIGFMPYVGNKQGQVDEAAIAAAELVWRTGFEVATAEEAELAAQKRLEKDKAKKSAIGELLKDATKKRAEEKAKARTAHSTLSKHRTAVNKKLEKCEGEAFINYGSRDQLLEALQKMPGMKTIKDTQDDTLLKYNDRPLIQTLRKYNKGRKDTGTYGMQWTQRWVNKALAKEGWRHPMDGRLHCMFNQLEAETGRTSSSKPNAQNLPTDDEVRACFICDPPNPQFRISTCCHTDAKLAILSDGVMRYLCDACTKECLTEAEEQCILTEDMSGAELRIIAELAKAMTWITAFARGWDVHSVSTEILEPQKWPALALKDCAYYELDETGEKRRQKCACPGHAELRQKTKSINFMLCYGGGPDALADELGITLDAAKELMRQHEAAFPDVWGYLERSGKLAQTTREARDMFGRRRSFPEPTEEMAKDWYESEYKEKLELSEAAQEANIFNFKATQLRKPTKIEEYKLTHRSPDWKEIRHAMRSLEGSIGRRGKNHCIQGTNASIIKRAMGCGFDKDGKPYLWHTLPQYRAKVQNMVHDELVIGCPLRYAEAVAALVADAFARAAAEVMSKVKMESEYHISNRWMK